MTNDQFFLFPILSYGNKNTLGAVARLFFSDPPLTPHANEELKSVKHGIECTSPIEIVIVIVPLQM